MHGNIMMHVGIICKNESKKEASNDKSVKKDERNKKAHPEPGRHKLPI